MSTMRVVALLAFVALAAAGPPPVAAQAGDFCAEARTQTQQDSRAVALRELSRVGCLGDDKDPDPALAPVQNLLKVDGTPVGGTAAAAKDVTLSPEERQAVVRRVLQFVADYLGTVTNDANPEDRGELAKLAAAAQAAREAVDNGSATPETRPQFWQLDSGGPALAQPLLRIRGPAVDLLALLVRGDCENRPEAPRCTQAFTTAGGAIRAATLAERAMNVQAHDARQAALREAQRRDRRWDSYFTDVKSQFIWESLINGQLYQRRIRGSGLSGPPTSQFIVFHPTVAMEYVSGAQPGDKMKAALVLELLGYNRWQWGADDKPQNAWGGALVMTYADRAGVRSTGFGLSVIAMNRYVLTVTRHGGETGVMLSVDLTKKVIDADKDLRERFRLGQ